MKIASSSFPITRLVLSCLFFIACFNSAQAQYRNLVLEGGGIRGIAYGGALLELEKAGILKDIQRVAGTSAGALTAALLACGYSPDELSSIINNSKIQQFSDGRWLFIGGFHRLSKEYGWYRGDKLTAWLGQLIAQKTGNANLTFAELHQLATQGTFRDLYVTGTNLTLQKAAVFSYETYPHMQIKDAVRISVSIPFFFRAVVIDSLGHVVSKPAPAQKVSIMVDGGVVANYPITLFDSARYATADVVKLDTNSPFNPQTLGIRLDRAEQIAYDQQQLNLAPYTIQGFSSYLGAFYNLIIESLNRNALTSQDWDRTISINTLNFQPKIRKMSTQEKNALMESGRAGVISFLEKPHK